jgi:hypothetical protein
MRRLEVRQGELGHQEHGADVRPQGLVEGIDGVVLRLSGGEELACVIDQYVDQPVCTDTALDSSPCMVLLGDIARVGLCRAARAVDEMRNLVQRIGR